MYELMAEDTFDAAHALRGYKGSCENLHGHTWSVQVFLNGEELDKIGLLYDFREIKSKLKLVIDEFDHKNLNDLDIFKEQNPSSENLAKIIFDKLKLEIKLVSKVTVWESQTTKASYYESDD
ncbi:6-carboxytetrahydropterin synthase QueD [candidate division WOR-1 bacterium RIFOXYD2_FULL_36_8]|uniref:6-carboxy-5,6,7,8-tetrahydropterin synthase n=1 Tax=candidate division WOR-1 bacterium RIFOXYB2_FULL_36_35 TaxID=1802578 RepID=A0A1F4RYR8_UNCSA|nr:MAG: 6-carboxytetrahydropterin synthase QueD [candidate division WOR-1 bacterium RIFOXYA2_FULL_36_21]OGC13297.1 MAG: 6-carboxytetrahydropterin synthase QueD [candidate division WOR-1 bacterium RIFOXYB2_FULL_36_35]OGC16618.1 MAG: 6-carboxytetrahydropterin synthase QueD [candidate division WOR-1 bacterium RIFOXYA12_FULL_36_13]OGC37468.1 MAG: 6-carboxytetrahydropterin synthase QueD [candidate division WOR-1 bacterium RIFOXYD2_FULL_36_8]